MGKLLSEVQRNDPNEGNISKIDESYIHATLLVYKLVSLDVVEEMHAETPFCPIR